MSFRETVLLGALAGFTIYLGLPFARLRFVDVMSHGFEIVETAVDGYKNGGTSFGHALALALLLGGGFAAGSAGLSVLESRMRSAPGKAPPISGASADITVEEATALEDQAAAARARALRTGMTIAAAIGLHNFAEGLAIGVSASTGEISLATVLIVGFALHNATEGFGIVGPLGTVRPTWRWLALAGLVGGGPTFIGSMVGYNVTSQPLELAFYAVSGGAILYVVGEVWTAMRRYGHRELGLWLLAFGFFVGIATDLIVAYGGG
jgi:ZIP family zinc transporter